MSYQAFFKGVAGGMVAAAVMLAPTNPTTAALDVAIAGVCAFWVLVLQ